MAESATHKLQESANRGDNHFSPFLRIFINILI